MCCESIVFSRFKYNTMNKINIKKKLPLWGSIASIIALMIAFFSYPYLENQLSLNQTIHTGDQSTNVQIGNAGRDVNISINQTRDKKKEQVKSCSDNYLSVNIPSKFFLISNESQPS